MAMSFEKETARAKTRDGQPVSEFSGEIRNLDAMPLVKGDVFTIPTTFEVFKSKRFNDAQYILVTCEDGKVVQFFPSIFTKQRTVVDDDGKFTTEHVRTTGTAADLFNESADVQAGMTALKGKKIKVSDMKVVPTLRYGSDQKTNAQVPVLDLVG